MKIKNSNKKILIIFFVICLTVFVSLPSIIVKNPFVSPDIGFHINRILGLSEELSYGHFPVRMSSYWLNGYGYPASIYYGDIFLYFSAALHFLGVDIIASYNMNIIFLNFLTIIISYICFLKIFKNRRIAIVLTLVYSTSNYRLSDIYYRGALGESIALIFLPVIIYALYRIYSFKENHFLTAVLLAAGMAGVITSHIISAVLVVIGIIFVCLIFIKKTLNLVVIKTYLISVFLTLLISAYFIVPFLDYYISMDTLISDTVNSGNSDLFYNSAAVIEFFNFFGGSDKISYSPGLIMVLALLISFMLILYKKIDKNMIKIIVLSSLFLIISSNLFPWDFLVEHFFLFRFVSAIQFPFRFIILALMTLIFLLGMLLKKLLKNDDKLFEKLFYSISCSVILIMCVYIVGYLNNNHSNDRMDIDSTDIGAGREYILSGAEWNDFDNTDISCDGTIMITKQEGINREYSIEEYVNGSNITLPVLNYKYYKVYDEQKNEIDIYNSDTKLISFKLDNGYRGKIILRYEEPVIWKISELISAFSIVILSLVILGRKYIKGRKM